MVLLLFLFTFVSLIAGDKMLRYVVFQYYYIILWFITVPLNHVAKGVFFADVADVPLHDIFGFVCMVIVSFAGCTLFG